MFVRYSLTANATEVASRFSADVQPAYQPNYNAAPTHLLPVITQESPQGVSFFYWGAPPTWANKKPLGEKIINTRLDLIAEKTVLQKKLAERRCLIPADGFYEWKRAGKKTSIPYRFTLKDKGLFAIAGLWEEYEDAAGEMAHTFTVITTEASSHVIPVTDRMPVIIAPGLENAWLTGDNVGELLALLRSDPPALDFYSVSPQVNTPSRNDRTVILPAPPADQFGNLTLFD